jgi:homeobox-leucine zipper protein
MAAEGEGASTSNMEVEEGEEGSTIGGDQRVEEISSEYSGPMRSKSEDEFDGDEDDEGDGDNKQKKKKRKKYHRHTAEQIRIMEAYV